MARRPSSNVSFRVALTPRRERQRKRARAAAPGLIAAPLALLTAFYLTGGPGPSVTLDLSWQSAASATQADRESARFSRCFGPVRDDCVIDGDTFWYAGEKIRVADINTPEIGDPGCPREAELGAQATARLQALLNAGPFTLERVDRDRDPYGRLLRTVTRDGASVGAVLVREGLAEEWGGYRRGWC